MRRHLFYYYTSSALVFDFVDENDEHKDAAFMGYTLKEAIKKFRIDNGLQHKKIKVESLYK